MGGEKFNIVSYGCGANSTALLVGLHKHRIPVDLILFADTGGEHPHTYAYLNVMDLWLKDRGMPTITRVYKTTRDGNRLTLEDETFAALITEAEKYVGYPYVWGGSNPNTSFDCSGFVSWALTESGVCNTGRLGAQGLYNISTPVSSANARPGDLIFFVGTYDTPGVSHVGIYVGGGKMLHCGDPIQYADINTSYWQSHFYAFGRPPYD